MYVVSLSTGLELEWARCSCLGVLLSHLSNHVGQDSAKNYKIKQEVRGVVCGNGTHGQTQFIMGISDEVLMFVDVFQKASMRAPT